jgi:antitoxin VapB
VAIHIKNPAVTRLAAELASLTGDSKTEAIRKALEEKMARLSIIAARRARSAELARILGREVCTLARAGGRKRILTPAEVQELLAYGP